MSLPQRPTRIKPQEVGWIAVERAIRTHWVVGFGQPVAPHHPGRATYSRAEAWLDLLMECAYEVTAITNAGVKMSLQPGQMIAGITFLAERWNWSPKTVRNFLEKLEGEQMASRETEKGRLRGKQAATLTICNYAEYQIIQYLEGQAAGKQRAGTQAQKGQQYKDNTLTSNTLTQEGREETGASVDAASAALNGSTTAIAERIAASPDPKRALKDLGKIVEALTPKTEVPAKDKQGSRIKADWVLSKRLGDYAIEYFQITPDQVRAEAIKFKEWWSAQPGVKARKLDWDLTWMSWVRRSYKSKKAEEAPIAADLAGQLGAAAKPASQLTQEEREEMTRQGMLRDAKLSVSTRR